jgi:hypothetical protein
MPVHHVRMRALFVCVSAVAAAALLAIGTASGASRTRDSGIRGTVLYGPTCPVQRPGRICERPYAASITIRRAHTRALVMRVHSGADGRFTARLAPGRYLLVPRNGHPYPRARSQTVSVHRDSFTLATIHFDSGIR